MFKNYHELLKRIKQIEPSLGKEERKEMLDVLDSGWYTEAKKGLFELKKPKNIGIGFDELPNYILKTDLTGNELAKLASVESIPDFVQSDYNFSSSNEIIYSIKKSIKDNDIDRAWQLVLYLGNFSNDK